MYERGVATWNSSVLDQWKVHSACMKGAWNRMGGIKFIATSYVYIEELHPMATVHDSCTKGAWLCATTVKLCIFHQAIYSCFKIFRIYLKHKNWLVKIWRIYGHSPNLPTFPPTKVSLHTVYIFHR